MEITRRAQKRTRNVYDYRIMPRITTRVPLDPSCRNNRTAQMLRSTQGAGTSRALRKQVASTMTVAQRGGTASGDHNAAVVRRSAKALWSPKSAIPLFRVMNHPQVSTRYRATIRRDERVVAQKVLYFQRMLVGATGVIVAWLWAQPYAIARYFLPVKGCW